MAGLVGGEFFSVVNLVITRQEQLRAIDPENNLLKCNISFNGGDLGYDPYLYELFGSIAINEAMDKLYWRLESVNKLRNI